VNIPDGHPLFDLVSWAFHNLGDMNNLARLVESVDAMPETHSRIAPATPALSIGGILPISGELSIQAIRVGAEC
jgi:hypothetical protein